MKYILSFGGGLNSTALLVYLLNNKFPLDLVLFADTGNENDYTYESVKFYKEWTESKGIRFDIVRSKNAKDLYSYCYDKKVTPSRMTRNCTKNFKITPMRQHMRLLYGKKPPVVLYIGIALEESHRMRDSDRKYITNKYPLVDAKIDRNGCETLLREEGLPVPKKSGCWYCPFRKKQEWIDMLKDRPDMYEKAIALETNSKHYPSKNALLNHIPLIKMRDNVQKQGILGSDFEPSCDISGSCFL